MPVFTPLYLVPASLAPKNNPLFFAPEVSSIVISAIWASTIIALSLSLKGISCSKNPSGFDFSKSIIAVLLLFAELENE